MTANHQQEARLSELIRKSQDGDNDAYLALLKELSVVIRSYVGRRIGDTSAVEEVVQEVLIAIHSVRHTYHPEKPFFPWFYAIVRHRYIDYLRKWGRIYRTEISDSAFIDQSPAQEPGNSSRQRAEEAIAGLPMRQRQALELLKLEGLSVREAAEQLNTSEGALKVMAHRAYKTLRKAYRKEEP